MKIGIIAAMPEELSGILARLTDKVPRQVGDRTYWEGGLHGFSVTAVLSRWGKVASAATTAILISRLEVEHIMFVGVAGAIDRSLGLGDIVVASELIQHDMDASAIPAIKRFEIPVLGRQRLPVDDDISEMAARAASDLVDDAFDRTVRADTRQAFGMSRPRVLRGLIASGDRFIADARSAEDLRRLLPDVCCVEMEGAAVAQVCFELGVGVTVVRIISDRADHDAPVDFARFCKQVASIMAENIAVRFLQTLAAARAGTGQVHGLDCEPGRHRLCLTR